MLFGNLPQSMSAQQFADLQQGNRYAPERPIETEHMSLRQMLQKREREISEATRCELPNQRSEMNGNCQEIEDGGNKDSDEHKPSIINTAPTWLSNAMLQQAHNAAGASASSTNSYSQWLSMPINAMHHTEGSNPNPDMVENVTISAQQSHGSSGQGKGFLDLHADTANSSDLVDGEAAETDDHNIWQNAKLKAEIVSHPLYEQLLAAHVACLRTATPVDQLSKIDAQLGHSHQVAAKYSILNNDQNLLSKDKEELNEFMAHYVTLLRSFKDQLQQHVRVHAMEAVVACWELEQSLMSLTGVSPGEGTGATMSDEEDEHSDSDPGYFDCMDGHDASGFGPLIPTETERTLMERVRHELKLELKQGYRARINDVREEILRKRRAGKLPGDTTSVLKSWWHAHSKWPYPSEDEKARLVQETGLELKQINNWFINQRKRNWHSNPSSSASLKNKRKN